VRCDGPTRSRPAAREEAPRTRRRLLSREPADEPEIYLAPAFPPPLPVVVVARSTADASRAASQTVQVKALPAMAR
jgi:hypothetical protein